MTNVILAILQGQTMDGAAIRRELIARTKKQISYDDFYKALEDMVCEHRVIRRLVNKTYEYSLPE